MRRSTASRVCNCGVCPAVLGFTPYRQPNDIGRAIDAHPLAAKLCIDARSEAPHRKVYADHFGALRVVGESSTYTPPLLASLVRWYGDRRAADRLIVSSAHCSAADASATITSLRCWASSLGPRPAGRSSWSCNRPHRHDHGVGLVVHGRVADGIDAMPMIPPSKMLPAKPAAPVVASSLVSTTISGSYPANSNAT